MTKRKGVIFKIDFEKAYDSEVLKGKGFDSLMVERIVDTVKGGGKYVYILMGKMALIS
jgi:hypothetical protein